MTTGGIEGIAHDQQTRTDKKIEDQEFNEVFSGFSQLAIYLFSRKQCRVGRRLKRRFGYLRGGFFSYCSAWIILFPAQHMLQRTQQTNLAGRIERVNLTEVVILVPTLPVRDALTVR